MPNGKGEWAREDNQELEQGSDDKKQLCRDEVYEKSMGKPVKGHKESSTGVIQTGVMVGKGVNENSK